VIGRIGLENVCRYIHFLTPVRPITHVHPRVYTGSGERRRKRRKEDRRTFPGEKYPKIGGCPVARCREGETCEEAHVLGSKGTQASSRDPELDPPKSHDVAEHLCGKKKLLSCNIDIKPIVYLGPETLL